MERKTFIVIYTYGVVSGKDVENVEQHTKIIYAKNKYDAIINFDRFMDKHSYYLLDIDEFDNFDLSINKGE